MLYLTGRTREAEVDLNHRNPEAATASLSVHRCRGGVSLRIRVKLSAVLCRQLDHRGRLAFTQAGNIDKLAIGQLQRIVVRCPQP